MSPSDRFLAFYALYPTGGVIDPTARIAECAECKREPHAKHGDKSERYPLLFCQACRRPRRHVVKLGLGWACRCGQVRRWGMVGPTNDGAPAGGGS